MNLLEPGIIFTIYGFNVTNTIFSTLLVDFILVLLVFIIYKHISIYPSRLQSISEATIDYFYTLTKQISGERAKSIFPWVISFFIFILFSNLTGLVPGLGTFGIVEEGNHGIIPFFKPPTSDFNTTFALATISLVATHALSIKYNGLLGYLGRFFSLNPVYLYVGILELISEVTKLFSLSFRLFGNVFAGEVVLETIFSIFAFLAPIPFLLLESIVALVQALVFAMLTMAFMGIMTNSHGEQH
ncbi:F0F1 ATP synthase subunit A [Candidatus Parcubacteria bacterium]|nr:MAG: F0F1 ATP synthase subunit A [Candidatus Parcubacteria bacterium]